MAKTFNYDKICVSLSTGEYFLIYLIIYFHYRVSGSWELKYGFALLNLFLSEWCNALQIIIMLSRNNCGKNIEFIQILIEYCTIFHFQNRGKMWRSKVSLFIERFFRTLRRSTLYSVLIQL